MTLALPGNVSGNVYLSYNTTSQTAPNFLNAASIIDGFKITRESLFKVKNTTAIKYNHRPTYVLFDRSMTCFHYFGLLLVAFLTRHLENHVLGGTYFLQKRSSRYAPVSLCIFVLL